MPPYVNNIRIYALFIFMLIVLTVGFLPAPQPISEPVVEKPIEQSQGNIENTEAPLQEQRTPDSVELRTAPSATPTGNILQELSEKLRIAQEQLDLLSVSIPKKERIRLPSHELYDRVSASIVNFFCDIGDGTIAVATGVIIDERGYVLTNAHIVDEPGPQTCLLRNGSPAQNFAVATRVFTSPGFDTTLLEDANLRHDVAIWKIREPAGTTPLPAHFSAITVDTSYRAQKDNPLATFSYPAELLGSQAIVRSLYLLFSETIVQQASEFFIESTQGIGSQKGSSGGVLIDPFTGDFAGLIFAIAENKNSTSGSVSDRSLFSLTPHAVDQTVYTATGKTLVQFLATNP